ncbi:hypothetical protein, partial [Mesorhizobium sp. M4B.F.Ca.ET.019.03.1.1]|uniref:hypothetical protein n=1 Tax=Mesorhizobium sp. M4B.F.Ca.ET.019.03.1.1 TaxID=2496651 RepID=UPI001AECF66A
MFGPLMPDHLAQVRHVDRLAASGAEIEMTGRISAGRVSAPGAGDGRPEIGKFRHPRSFLASRASLF